MNRSRAVSDSLLAVFHALDDTAHVVSTEAPLEEAQAFRQEIGRICGILVFDLLETIYKEHPELKPPNVEVTSFICPLDETTPMDTGNRAL